MIKLDVRVDIEKALSTLARLPGEIREKATVGALNDTAAWARTQGSREIRAAGYNIKSGAIKKEIKITRATRTQLVAVIKASGRPIGLINYDARQVKSGVSVKVKNGRKIIKGAFIAKMPNGHEGVFIRKGTDHRKVMKNGKAVWSGLPIEELYGPSIPIAFANDVVQGALISGIRDKFPEFFQRRLRYLSLKH